MKSGVDLRRWVAHNFIFWSRDYRVAPDKGGKESESARMGGYHSTRYVGFMLWTAPLMNRLQKLSRVYIIITYEIIELGTFLPDPMVPTFPCYAEGRKKRNTTRMRVLILFLAELLLFAQRVGAVWRGFAGLIGI